MNKQKRFIEYVISDINKGLSITREIVSGKYEFTPTGAEEPFPFSIEFIETNRHMLEGWCIHELNYVYGITDINESQAIVREHFNKVNELLVNVLSNG